MLSNTIDYRFIDWSGRAQVDLIYHHSAFPPKIQDRITYSFELPAEEAMPMVHAPVNVSAMHAESKLLGVICSWLVK